MRAFKRSGAFVGNIASLSLVWALSLGCGGAQPTTARSNPDAALGDHDARRQVPQASTTVRDGEAKLSAGDVEAARALFEQAIAENPDDARAQLDLGLTLEALGDATGAERAYRRATEIDATLAEAHNNLGVLLREKDDLPGAIAAFNAAIGANPRSASAHANLALALEDSGDAAGAEREYRAALEAAPGDVMVRANLGLLLLAQGKDDEGKRELRTAASNARDNRAALVAIGNGLRRAGDAGGAVDAMRAAIAAGDGEPTPALLAELALALLGAGSRPMAIDTLKQAIALDASFAVAHYVIANMYAADQQLAAAATHYKKYLQLDPQGVNAAQARERLSIVERGTRAQRRP